MSAATIPLMYQSPQIADPTQLAQRNLSLQQMAQSYKIGQQELAQKTLQAKQLQRQQEDQQTLNQAFLDNKGDWDATRKSILGKVSMQTLQQMDADHVKQQQAALSLTNEKRLELQMQNQLIGTTAASLLQLPPEQRLSAYQNALKQLQAKGIDVSSYDPNTAPDDQHLMSMAAAGNYAGQLYTYAQKQALAKRSAEQAEAQKQEEAGKQMQRDRENAARSYQTVNNQEAHDAWLKSLPESIRAEYSGIGKYDPKNQQSLDNMAMTGEQREQARLRAQQEANTLQWHQDAIDVRNAIAQQNAAFHDAMIGLQQDKLDRTTGAGGQKPLTQGQLKVEERNIDSIENGTASRPGINAQRLDVGRMLRTNKDEKGQELDAAGQDRLKTKMQGLDDRLQSLQFRKAKLYGIGSPDPEDVKAAKDGEEIEAEDGSVWKKQGGVAFFSRMAGQQAKASTILTKTPPPGPAATPAAAKSTQQPQQRVFPRARLQAFAQANNMSPEQAEQALKSQNYVVQ